MFKYVITTVVLGVVWSVISALGLPTWIAMAVSGVLIASVSSAELLVRRRRRKAARGLEDGICQQAQTEIEVMSPERQERAQEMERAFVEAVRRLKRSRLAGGGEEALYALPWYVVIGPPGAGKSVAIHSAGIDLLDADDRLRPVSGIGGTRDCKWWFSSQAVILDTAGRYMSGGAEQDEWSRFLALLRKHRRRKPINGILVTIGAETLMAAARGVDDEQEGPGELETHALKIRERINELADRLDVVVPVYVLVTKCDLIPGFRETFADLRGRELRQIWGFTAPTSGAPSPSELFEQEFNQIIAATERRATLRISEEPRIGRRARILELSPALTRLGPQLGAFLELLFMNNPLHEQPIFRGVYMTSGMQEGNPIEGLTRDLLGGLGLASHTEPPRESAGQYKSFFLADLFAKVVFPDQRLAARSKGERRRRRRRRLTFATASTAAAAVFSYSVHLSYAANESLLTDVRRPVTALQDLAFIPISTRGDAEAYTQRRFDARWLEQLGSLHATRGRLNEHGRDGAPLPARLWGMYRADALLVPIEQFYIDQIEDAVYRPALMETREQLGAFVRARAAGEVDELTPEQYTRIYAALRFYLLGTWIEDERGDASVKEQTEVLPGESDARELISTYVHEIWARKLDSEREAATLMRDYIPVMVEKLDRHAKRDLDLVREVRAILAAAAGPDQCTLEHLAGLVPGAPATLAELVGDSSAFVRSRGELVIPRLYTPTGWSIVSREFERLEALCGGGDWVLGTADPELTARARARRDELMQDYFDAYEQAWRALLGSVDLNFRDGECSDLRVILDGLRETPGPVRALADAVRRGTVLYPEAPSTPGAGAASPGQGASPLMAVARRWIGAPPDERWRERARQLSGAFVGFTSFAEPRLGAGSQKPWVAADAFAVLVGKIAALVDERAASISIEDADQQLRRVRLELDSLIKRLDDDWRVRYRQLLSPVYERSLNCLPIPSEGPTTEWCSESVIPFARGLQRRYPFDADARAEVGVSELLAFYHPVQGSAWKFYDTYLASILLPTTRGGYEWADTGDAARARHYTPSLRRFYAKTQALTDMLFPGGAEQPLFEFDVHVRPVETPGVLFEEIRLTVGSSSASFTNARKRWHNLRWPDEEPGASIELHGRRGDDPIDERIERRGVWALFRLLEDAEMLASADGRLTSFTLALPDQDDIRFTIDLRTVERNPYVSGRAGRPKLLGPFRHPHARPPARIFRRGERCPDGR